MAMTIIRIDAGWIVQASDGSIAAGPFPTNAEAWRALDRIERQPVSPQEKRTDWMWEQDVSSRRML